MKRAIQNIICVLTICSMIAVVGCGDKKKEGAKSGDTAGETSKADDKK